VRLLDFPNAGARRAKYEGFKILNEAGDTRRATTVLYKVPSADQSVFSVPGCSWTNGWHLALSDREMAMLFALWSHRGAADAWPPDVVVVLDGETQTRRHGLSPDAYGTHRTLGLWGTGSDGRRRASR
jgi:hypothetical protein